MRRSLVLCLAGAVALMASATFASAAVPIDTSPNISAAASANISAAPFNCIAEAVITAPTQGRMVLFTQPSDEKPKNGTRTHPAIVTAVHGTGESPLVNLTVFFDAHPPEFRGSVFRADAVPEGMIGPIGTWDWPPRVT